MPKGEVASILNEEQKADLNKLNTEYLDLVKGKMTHQRRSATLDGSSSITTL